MMKQRASVSSARRTLALVAIGAAVFAAPATAQLARVTTSRDAVKLIVLPFARPDRDSALSVQLANAMRERFTVAFTDRFNVVTKRLIDTNLVSSGFPVDMPLDPTNARQLARVLNARLLVEGVIIPLGDDSVEVSGRMAETIGQMPQSASYSVRLERRRVGNGTANEIANRLADFFRSFDPAKQCQVFRQGQPPDFTKALQQANDALRRYPNSSQALLCKAQVMRAQNAPADSVIAVLTAAQNSDSMNVVAQWQLARYYEERGDTLGLIHSLHHVLVADFNNNDVRISLARLFFAKDMPDSALTVLDTALNRNPNQADLLDMRSRVYAASRRYAQAGADLARIAELDTAKVDSAFVFRTFSIFQLAADTTNMITWARKGTARWPTDRSYWYSLMGVYGVRADTASAMQTIRDYKQAAPGDPRADLMLAGYLYAQVQLDSAKALAIAAATADSTLRANAAGILFGIGARLRAEHPDSAAAVLTQAKSWGATLPAQTKAQIAFFLGIAQYQLAVAADSAANAANTPAQSAARCDAARREAALIDQVEANVTEGGRTAPDTAQQILTQAVPAYRQRAQAFIRQARCPAQ